MSGKIKPENLAECFPVGTFLREEIQWHGWTVEEFARHCHISLDRLERIVEDGDNCTMKEAEGIGAALDVSPAFLLSLQITYIRWKKSTQQSK